MPTFDDAPAHVVPKKAASVPSTPSAADVVGDPLANVPEGGGFVKHAQFNSPLQLYSDANAADALAAQSGGQVTALKRQKYVSGGGTGVVKGVGRRCVREVTGGFGVSDVSLGMTL